MSIRWPLLAALAFASPIFAQSKPQDGNADIVVEGSRDRDRQIRQFINALTDAPVGGQLSRFDWAVCPAAVGLREQQTRAIAARMRRVAAAAGIRTGRANCRPNALVIAVGDKKEFIAALRRQYPAYFTDALGQSVHIQAEPGPVTAWHVEGLLDSNGVPPPVHRGDDGAKYFVVTSNDATRLLPASRPHFLVGIVVVERQALAGLTTTQLADYAAMRIFARTDPGRTRASKAPTILTVVEAPMGAVTPITLTEWDLGFLKALYASGERQYANSQRGEMKRLLRNDLEKSEEEAKR